MTAALVFMLCLLVVLWRGLIGSRRREVAETAIPAWLAGGELSGSELRDILKRKGVPLGLASFYMMMSRMEDDGLVIGRYEDYRIGEHSLRRRVYRLP